MRKERFQIAKILGGVLLVIPAFVGVIQIVSFFTTASSDVSATVESTVYQVNPKLGAYVKKTFASEWKAIGSSSLLGGSSGGADYLPSGDSVSDLVYNLELQNKHGAGLAPEMFSTYRVVNSGDKAALDARLMNVVGSVAMIEGDKEVIEVKGKTAINLGQLDPRSTKIIHVWSESYYMHAQTESPFVLYDGGAVDVDRLIVVGGVYRHLHDYGVRYLIFLGAVFLALLSFGLSALLRRTVSSKLDVSALNTRGKRSRKRKRNPNPPSSES